MKDSKIFKEIVRVLIPYKPEKIFLFGSWAWGKPTGDSDIDLLIVKKTKENPYQRIPKASFYLLKIDKAFDVLVLTPKELKKRLRLRDFFIKEIVEKGKVLYEKK